MRLSRLRWLYFFGGSAKERNNTTRHGIHSSNNFSFFVHLAILVDMKLNFAKDGSLLGLLSVVMTPLALVFGIIITVLFEGMVIPANESMRAYVPVVTRVMVLSMITMIATGMLAALIALLKKDEPRWMPVLGLGVTACMIMTFHFVAVGPNGD